MDWTWYLFAFEGRINRARMWLAALIIVGWMVCLGFVVLGVSNLLGISLKSVHYGINDVFGVVDPDTRRALFAFFRDTKGIASGKLVLALIDLIAMLLFVWVYMAASIKRLHDRNKSGWWMIAFFVIPGLFEQFQDQIDVSWMAMLLGLMSAALFIWGYIELFFMKGISGNNRYGADPLLPTASNQQSR